MQVESTTQRSRLTYIKRASVLENLFWSFLIGCLRQVYCRYKLQYGCGHNVDTMTYVDVTNHMFHPLSIPQDAINEV